MSDRYQVSIAARLERLPLTAYQRTLFLIIATAWFFDSIDLGSLTFILGSIRSDFGLSAAQTGLLSSMSFVGMFLGAAIAGIAADRYGRTLVFQASMIFWGAGGIACGLAPSVTALGAARALLGFGMGMEFPVAQSIVSEIIPARVRGRYLALLEGFWPLGFIAAGLIAHAVLPIGGWRWVFLIEAAPAVLVFVVRLLVPESPRWLAVRGRMAAAEEVMQKFERAVSARLGDAVLPEPQPQAVEQAVVSRFPFLELWSGQYIRRTTMVWLLWFFALLGYYGLTTWLGALLQEAGYSVTQSVYYATLISLAGVPGFFTAAYLIEAWGRKPACVAALIGAAVSAWFYGTAATQTELIAWGLALQFFQFGMWSVLYAYTPELYPTRSRATGAGCASAIGRLGSLLGPYAVGLILPRAGQAGVFALGAGTFLIAALNVLLLGVETRGKTLEAISA
jgi:putative MFS transporter